MLVGWCPRAVRPGQLTYSQPKRNRLFGIGLTESPKATLANSFPRQSICQRRPSSGGRSPRLDLKASYKCVSVILIDAIASSLEWCARHRERSSGAGTTINLSTRRDKFVDAPCRKCVCANVKRLILVNYVGTGASAHTSARIRQPSRHATTEKTGARPRCAPRDHGRSVEICPLSEEFEDSTSPRSWNRLS